MKSWSWSWTFGLCLDGLGVEEKVLQFFKTFVVIRDGSEQGTPWHFVRDNKSSLPFGSHCLREPSALHAHQPQLRWYLTMGAICYATQTPVNHSAQIVENCFHSVTINQESKQFTGWNVIQKNATKISAYCTWGKRNPVNKAHLQKRRNWTRYWRRIVELTWWLNVWKRKKNTNIIRWLSFFRPKIIVQIRFRFVFSRKWNSFSSAFSFTAESE